MNFFTKVSTLAVVTFCAGVATTNAQSAIVEIGSNITSTDQLQNDTKVAFYNTGRSLYVYNSTNRYEMGNAPTMADQNNMTYCWTVEKLDNGKFKFKDSSNKYVPVLGSGASVTGSDQGDEFTVTASNGKWLIQGTDGNYFNGNGAGAGFCGWGASGGNSLYEIRLVTVDDLSAFKNYTITMQDASGSTFGTQTVNSKAGYTVSVASPFRNATAATYNGQPVTVTNNTITIPEGESTDLVVTYEDNLPFKTTEIQNGEFVNATWYQLGIHNNSNRTYLQYNSEDQTIINLIGGNATNIGDDSQLWCFSGNMKDGIKIYNKAAGTGVSISYSTAYGTGTDKHAIMADANAEAAIWHLTTSSATESELSNGFCFETTQATDSYKYLNQRNTFMSYWNNNGNGSTFIINDAKTASLTAFNAALDKAKQYVLGNSLGQYQDPNGTFATTLAKAESGAPEDLAERVTLTNELKEATNSLVINQPAAGKFYRLKGKTTNKYVVSYAESGRPVMTDNGSDQTTVFYLSADNRLTGYTSLNMSGNGNFYNDLGHSFTFSASPVVGYYTIRQSSNANGYLLDYSATNGKLDNWSDASDERCAWTLEEVTETAQQPSLNKTMSAEYATLAAPVALNIPEGVKAYTVTLDEEKATATLEEVSNVIPAGTAVVLKKTGNGSDFTFTFAAEGSTSNANALTGVYADTEIATDINAYILGNGNKGIGFYQMNGTDRTLGANKAYLTLPTAASAVRSIIFSDGQTTGIESTVAEGTEAEEYYDLQGRRVMNPTKGIYVTKSGKKVVINK